MKRLNCAIYTRKSSDEGLEKEFNSLDAQREACAAFVLSQKHAGWTALPDLYDDGGLSGGTMVRPALQRLLGDIQAGKVQIVVVYKVDRLQNHIYRGEIAHQGNIYSGQHEPIIDAELWQRVQEKLSGNRQARALGANAEEPSLFAGLIVDGSGQRMTPTHAVKKGRRYRYYVSTSLITGARSDHAKGWRIPAGDVEGLVLHRLHALFASEPDMGEALSYSDLDASTLRAALTKAMQLAEAWTSLPSIKVRELVRSVIETVEIQDEKVIASLKRKEIASVLLGNTFSLPAIREPETFELCIDAKLRRAGKGIRLVVGGGITEKPDGQMVALLRDAHATRDAIMTGRDETIDAMGERLGVKRDYLSARMRVTYLAPDIVRAFVSGRYPPELTPARLLSAYKDLPHDWQLQRAALGFETR